MGMDRFSGYAASPDSPATDAFAITPSDTVELPAVTKAIYVGSGHVTLRPVHASGDVTYRNVPTGSYLTVRSSHVRATGTTAGDLIGEA
jgi:hypothetical protein